MGCSVDTLIKEKNNNLIMYYKINYKTFLYIPGLQSNVASEIASEIDSSEIDAFEIDEIDTSEIDASEIVDKSEVIG